MKIIFFIFLFPVNLWGIKVLQIQSTEPPDPESTEPRYPYAKIGNIPFKVGFDYLPIQRNFLYYS